MVDSINFFEEKGVIGIEKRNVTMFAEKDIKHTYHQTGPAHSGSTLSEQTATVGKVGDKVTLTSGVIA